jgi:hypothetical protein
LNSLYEPGQRSGAWRKMRVNRGQEFVIGGYTLGGKSFDALIFGYYDGPNLIYAGRTRKAIRRFNSARASCCCGDIDSLGRLFRSRIVASCSGVKSTLP